MNEEIKVVDKRRFNESGEVRSESSETTETKEKTSAPESPVEKPTEYPPIDFVNFTLSLATSAQLALGLMSHPETGAQMKDLHAAKQTIDILGMISDKTKGNLNEAEEKLLSEVLYTLRLQYVEVSKIK